MFDDLIAHLQDLLKRTHELETSFHEEIQKIPSEYQDSAKNLLHYLSIRQLDLRSLQQDLASLGLSSLGRMEAHTKATLEAVLNALNRLANRPLSKPGTVEETQPRMESSEALLAGHSQELLGPSPADRTIRIMVTMPSEAATDSGFVRRLLEAGMNVMRINCAHGRPEDWVAMVSNLRQAQRETRSHCLVLADLGGQKLRTGPLATSEGTLKVKPLCAKRGQVTTPSRIWITSKEQPKTPSGQVEATVGVEEDLIMQSRPGDTLMLVDARGKHRTLQVATCTDRSCLAESRKAVHLSNGNEIILRRQEQVIATGTVVNVPNVEIPLVLYPGSVLILTSDGQPSRAAVYGPDQQELERASISCSQPEVFSQVRAGQAIWFDDGAIGGVIETVDHRGLLVTITHAKPKGSKLRADKSINFPDTDFELPALTSEDVQHLAVLAPSIDMVGLSFLRKPEDVLVLEDHLRALNAEHLGIILKIENRQAFEQLPHVLLAGLRSPPVGVMVARGDLAVEVGFERLAEVQEEILWLCEAAHVPVIWATQVLEGLAKTGFPTRAEVTDAAMSGRAKCVMMNKGPYIVNAVEFLRNILERMQTHQRKKFSTLRKLAVSQME